MFTENTARAVPAQDRKAVLAYPSPPGKGKQRETAIVSNLCNNRCIGILFPPVTRAKDLLHAMFNLRSTETAAGARAMPREARKVGCKDLTPTERGQVTVLRAANQSYHHTATQDIEHAYQTIRSVMTPTSVRSDRDDPPPIRHDYWSSLPR